MRQTDFCKDCHYWTGDRSDDKGQGECRRFPVAVAGIVPQMNMLTQKAEPAILSGWATAKAFQWCGEFKQYSTVELNG